MDITEIVYNGSSQPLAKWFRDTIVSALPAINIVMVTFDAKSRRAERWDALVMADEMVNPENGDSVLEQIIHFCSEHRSNKTYAALINMNKADADKDSEELQGLPLQIAETICEAFMKLETNERYLAVGIVVTEDDYRFVMPRTTSPGEVTAIGGKHSLDHDEESEGEDEGHGIAHNMAHDLYEKAKANGDHEMAALIRETLEADHENDPVRKRVAVANLARFMAAKLDSEGFGLPLAAEPFETPKRRSIFELPPLDDDDKPTLLN